MTKKFLVAVDRYQAILPREKIKDITKLPSKEAEVMFNPFFHQDLDWEEFGALKRHTRMRMKKFIKFERKVKYKK